MKRTALLLLAFWSLLASCDLHAQCIGTTLTSRACAGDTFIAYNVFTCTGCSYQWQNALSSNSDSAFYASPAPLGYAIEAQPFTVALQVTDTPNACSYFQYIDFYTTCLNSAPFYHCLSNLVIKTWEYSEY